MKLLRSRTLTPGVELAGIRLSKANRARLMVDAAAEAGSSARATTANRAGRRIVLAIVTPESG